MSRCTNYTKGSQRITKGCHMEIPTDPKKTFSPSQKSTKCEYRLFLNIFTVSVQKEEQHCLTFSRLRNAHLHNLHQRHIGSTLSIEGDSVSQLPEQRRD